VLLERNAAIAATLQDSECFLCGDDHPRRAALHIRVAGAHRLIELRLGEIERGL
jgi:hypothetical protein